MQKLFRIIPLLFLLLCAEAHGEPFKRKKGVYVPNQRYIEYYKKAGYPDNVAQGLAEVIEAEGGSIARPREGDKHGRVGFSVTKGSHLYPELGLDKRDFKANPVTEAEALAWVPKQFKGWDLTKAGNVDATALKSLLHAGYLANPDKSKPAFDALLAGKPIPFPSNVVSGDKKEQDRIDRNKVQYHQATGLELDGTPDGSTSSSRSQSIKIGGSVPSKRDYVRADVDISKALLPKRGGPANAPQPASTDWYDNPFAPPVERPKSSYRELLERIVRGEPLDTNPPAPEDLLKEAQEYSRQRWKKQ